jgi:copper transport protein
LKRTALLLLLFASLVAPATASAHANLVATRPADRARLVRGPRAVVVRFDDTVTVGAGNAVVDNASGASVLGGEPRARGRVLTLPLGPQLGGGDYSVRWSIVSDDGHLERGVLAFAVGAAAPTPRSILGASVPLTWSDIVLRSLYYLGVLAAGGTTLVGLLLSRRLGSALLRPLAHLLFFGFLAAFVGGSGIVHAAAPGTRYVLVLKLALAVALAGGAAAALAPAQPRLLRVAEAAGVALLAAPTFAGHALDPSQPRYLSVPADLAHLASAATWLGGLLAIVYVLPRAAPRELERLAATRRVAAGILVAVLVLGASGLARALTELSAVSQVWSTSYGRTLVVKTAFLALLLTLGALNRRRLRATLDRLRRPVAAELLLITVVVVAVSVLTELRPGRDRPHSAPVAVSPVSR